MFASNLLIDPFTVSTTISFGFKATYMGKLASLFNNRIVIEMCYFTKSIDVATLSNIFMQNLLRIVKIAFILYYIGVCYQKAGYNTTQKLYDEKFVSIYKMKTAICTLNLRRSFNFVLISQQFNLKSFKEYKNTNIEKTNLFTSGNKDSKIGEVCWDTLL